MKVFSITELDYTPTAGAYRANVQICLDSFYFQSTNKELQMSNSTEKNGKDYYRAFAMKLAIWAWLNEVRSVVFYWADLKKIVHGVERLDRTRERWFDSAISPWFDECEECGPFMRLSKGRVSEFDNEWLNEGEYIFLNDDFLRIAVGKEGRNETLDYALGELPVFEFPRRVPSSD